MFTIPPPQLPQLRAIAHRIAVGMGDAHPAWVRITFDRHEHAESTLMGSSGVSDGPVYVLAMRGRFVDKGATGPPGAGAPRGNTVVVILGRKSLRDLDFAIGTNLPVSKLHGWRALR